MNRKAQANLDRAMTTLDEEWRKARNLLIGIAAASGRDSRRHDHRRYSHIAVGTP